MNGKNLVQWVLGLAFLFGCGNTQSGQAHCQTTADCERQGFSSHVCSPEGMCMPSTSGECKTNADCVDLTSSPVGRCLSAGKCVPLTQAGCTSILGDASRDDAIYVGLLAPLTGSGFAVELGKSITIAVDAAVQTYNQTVAEQPGDPRPLTVVICDETGDVQAATDHLVDTVGVTGILGPFDEARLVAVVEKTKAANVVVMSPFVDGLDFETRHGGSGLVWSCAANRSGALLYMKSLLDFVVEKIKSSRDPGFEPVVALYTSDDMASAQMGDQAIAKGVFPGSPTRVIYPYFLLAEHQTDYSMLARRAIDLQANLIVDLGSGLGDFDRIVSKIESRWSMDLPRPYYVTYQRSSGLVNVAVENLHPDPGAGLAPNVYQRTLVFDQPRSHLVEEAYNVFSSKFEGLAHTSPIEQMSLAYDCVSVLALGLQGARGGASTPPESVTGAQFKAGMQRLLSGEPWGFGVSPPSTSFTALSSSSSVDIFGASGDLPFAIEKGFPDPGGELWCFVLDATHRVKAAYRPTGVRFSPADGKQQGDFSCAPTW